MIINHNISALFAQRALKFNDMHVGRDMEKLSSGLRINRAGDDASGLAVSEKLRSQVRGLLRAEKNAADGISFIQTTEGYLQQTQDVLQRLRELAVQASNGVYSPEDRMQIQVEVSQLVDEVNRIASHAQFNGLNILTGRYAQEAGENVVTASMWVHIGANMDQRERVFIGTMTAQGLGIQGGNGLPHTATFISISTADRANQVIGLVDEALKAVNKQRADLGAYQNRLEHAIGGLLVGAENLQASESQIRDTDMAETMVSFVKNQILVQSATAMLAQANASPQSVLQLFQ
jgi:flagellin